MLQAMFNGVSAIEAHQERMDVIGNNIANVNTTAYKAGRVTFQDQLSQLMQGPSKGNGTTIGGTNPQQLGLGVRVGSIDSNMTQGGLQSTGRLSDMAIQGNGYFMVNENGNVAYTRDGSFTIDNQGNLVSAATGSYVLGWKADALGNIDTTPQISQSSQLSIPVGGLTSTSPTQTVNYGGNFSADATSTTGAYTRSVKVYDSLGKAQTVTLSFTKDFTASPATPTFTNATTGGSLNAGTYYAGISYTTASGETVVSSPLTVTVPAGTATNQVTLNWPAIPAGATGVNVYFGTSATAMHKVNGAALGGTSTTISAVPAATKQLAPAGVWNYSASSTDPGVTVTGTGQIYFDSSGNEITSSGNISMALTNGAKSPQTIATNFTGTTQVAGGTTTAPTGQDGFGPGTLESYTIDPTGTITGIFNNGFTRVLGQIALCDFANPAGLEKAGNNTYKNTVNSGIAKVGVATQESFGKISTGYLEQSNVDLSNEFTNMIVTQRGFQANTKIVTTVDQMLDDVIRLKS